MVRVDNITHFFADNETAVLKDIAFLIKKGEYVALTGPSGVGKSTLANILAGHIVPNRGKVYINGKDQTGIPTKKVMLLNQESDLFPWQTVEKHILFALDDKKSRENDLDRKDQLLELVKLKGHEKKYPCELSGGMKKRLSLARALAVKPELLILDEAFSSLDSNLKTVLYEELKTIWQASATTILMISHDSKEIKSLAERELVLAPGKPTFIIDEVRYNLNPDCTTL